MAERLSKLKLESILQYLSRHRHTPDLHSVLFNNGVTVEAVAPMTFNITDLAGNSTKRGLSKDETLEELMTYADMVSYEI